LSKQRLRITYARDQTAKDFTSRQLIDAWSSALTAASPVIAGAPRPRLALAAPAWSGMTSDAEVLDAFLEEGVPVTGLMPTLQEKLCAGLQPRSIQEVGLGWPSIQSDVRWAVYVATFAAEVSPAAVTSAVASFVAQPCVRWERITETRIKRIDLRQVVQAIAAPGEGACAAIEMRLQTDGNVTGRPDEVIAALGLPPAVRIHRSALGLATKSQVREAWRRSGRFAGG
jgi:radical SAM-linked protein